MKLFLHSCNRPSRFIGVEVAEATGTVVKGVFVDGQYTSYAIIVDVVDVKASSLSGGVTARRYRVPRRASEVKALGQRLARELPRAMIPAIPSRNYKIYALAHNQQHNKKPEQKVQYRRRLYGPWLQYAANVTEVHNGEQVEQFLGIAAGAQTCSDVLLAPCAARGSRDSAPLLYREAYLTAGAQQCADGTLAPTSEASAVWRRTQALLETDLRAGAGDTSTYSEEVTHHEHAEVSGRQGHVQVFSLQSAAYRELRTADR
jgi:hypothetical protein